MQQKKTVVAERQTRLERRVQMLAAQGKLKKGTGTMPDHLFKEVPPSLPELQGMLAQLMEDRERGR